MPGPELAAPETIATTASATGRARRSPVPQQSPAGRTDRPAAPVSHSEPPATVLFADCAEVHGSGRAPLLRGQAGYRPELDQDGDGVACNP